MSIFNGQADLLAELVAASSTFQTLTGTASVAAAKVFVKIAEAFDETMGSDTVLAYPRAIIADGGIVSRRKVDIGQMSGRGSLFLSFEIEIPTGNQTTILTQRTYFLDRVSAIISEMEVVSMSRATPSGYSTSHLQMQEINRVNGPGYVPIDEREQTGTYAPLWVMEFEIIY